MLARLINVPWSSFSTICSVDASRTTSMTFWLSQRGWANTSSFRDVGSTTSEWILEMRIWSIFMKILKIHNIKKVHQSQPNQSKSHQGHGVAKRQKKAPKFPWEDLLYQKIHSCFGWTPLTVSKTLKKGRCIPMDGRAISRIWEGREYTRIVPDDRLTSKRVALNPILNLD